MVLSSSKGCCGFEFSNEFIDIKFLCFDRVVRYNDDRVEEHPSVKKARETVRQPYRVSLDQCIHSFTKEETVRKLVSCLVDCRHFGFLEKFHIGVIFTNRFRFFISLCHTTHQISNKNFQKFINLLIFN